MISIRQPDGTHDIHLTSEEAGHLATALGLARPRGSATAKPSTGEIRVHVHADAAPAIMHHKPIEELMP